MSTAKAVELVPSLGYGMPRYDIAAYGYGL